MQLVVESLERRVCLSAAHAVVASHHDVPSRNSSVPYDLTAVAQRDGTIGLSWADENANVKQFVVQRLNSRHVFTTLARVRSASSYIDSNVSANTTYTYRVFAANVLTPSSAASVGVLSVSLVTTLNQVQVSWLPLSGSPQSYSVYRGMTMKMSCQPSLS